MVLPQKLCGSRQEGGQLSGAKDGAASEALRLSPGPETAGLCIPHLHPCSLPSAESWSQGDSRCQGLRHKPLGLADPCALTRKVAGCLEPEMAPPQRLYGSRPFQKLLASVFHTLTCRPPATESRNQGGPHRT